MPCEASNMWVIFPHHLETTWTSMVAGQHRETSRCRAKSQARRCGVGFRRTKPCNKNNSLVRRVDEEKQVSLLSLAKSERTKKRCVQFFRGLGKLGQLIVCDPGWRVTHLFYVLLAQTCGSGLPTSYAFTGIMFTVYGWYMLRINLY